MAIDLAALGYSTLHESNTTIIYRSSLPGLKDLLRVQGPLGEESDMKGRSTIRIIEPDLVVRTLMHGGFFRHITGNNFISPARTMREIHISSFLISHGIQTPEILAVRIREKGFFCNVEVISRLVPDSIDLLTYLETPRDDGEKIIMEAGKIIKNVHDLGVFHTDLHVKNLLLDSRKSMWILDLDKAYRFSSLPDFLKRQTIKRFFRSFEKWNAQGRIHLPGDWEHYFMQGYKALA